MSHKPSKHCHRVGSAEWVRFGLKITKRERETLFYTALGMVGKQIASKMGIALHTVKNHRCNAYIKLGVYTGAEAVAFLMVTDREFFEDVKRAIDEARNKDE